MSVLFSICVVLTHITHNLLLFVSKVIVINAESCERFQFFISHSSCVYNCYSNSVFINRFTMNRSETCWLMLAHSQSEKTALKGS